MILWCDPKTLFGHESESRDDSFSAPDIFSDSYAYGRQEQEKEQEPSTMETGKELEECQLIRLHRATFPMRPFVVAIVISHLNILHACV